MLVRPNHLYTHFKVVKTLLLKLVKGIWSLLFPHIKAKLLNTLTAEAWYVMHLTVMQLPLFTPSVCFSYVLLTWRLLLSWLVLYICSFHLISLMPLFISFEGWGNSWTNIWVLHWICWGCSGKHIMDACTFYVLSMRLHFSFYSEIAWFLN